MDENKFSSILSISAVVKYLINKIGLHIAMKLSNLKSLLENANTIASGQLKQYGMILPDMSNHFISYDDAECIQIFTDKAMFQKQLIKYFAAFTKNDDDLFLTYEEMCDHERFDAFNETSYFWDLF